MIKKYGFIALSLALLSSVAPVVANDCCGSEVKSECAQDEAANCCKSSEEACEACCAADSEEKIQEQLVNATKLDLKIAVRNEESAGTLLVVDDKPFSFGNNEMLIQMQVAPVGDDVMRIDVIMFVVGVDGAAVARGSMTRDAALGAGVDFEWADENMPVKVSVVALEKCMIAMPQESAPQA